MPDNASPERKLMLRALGADLVLTDPLEGTDGAIREARRLYAADPDRYFYPDQYNNDANWRAHYDTTAPEIIEQTSGRLTHFVAGLGTSGTFVGTVAAAAALQPAHQVDFVSARLVVPRARGVEAHGESAIVPGIYDPTIADEDLRISTRTRARHGAPPRARGRAARRDLFRRRAGSVIDVARTIDSGVIVTIFPDGAEKYLTDAFWTAR